MNSQFRHWLRNQWLDHVDEVTEWTGRSPTYTAADYFGKYKWWLRTVYRNRG